MKFIQLTNEDVPCWIRSDAIVYIHADPETSGSYIEYGTGDHMRISVNETPQEIEKLLQDD